MLKILLAGSVAVLAISGPVHAADVDSDAVSPLVDLPPPAQTKPDWTFTIGGGGVYAPTFLGSKEMKANPIPFVSLNYRDIVAIDGGGITLTALDFNGFRAGPVLKLGYSRDTKDDKKALRGLGDVALGAEGGAFVSYEIAPWASAQIEVRKGLFAFEDGREKSLDSFGVNQKIKGNEGIIAEFGADFKMPVLDNRLILSAGPRATWYDEDYAQTAFGVTAAQAARTRYVAYKPKAGFGKVGVAGSATWLFSERASVTVFSEYGRLIGPAAKSPIVKSKNGSEDQFSVGAALAYTFNY